MKSWTTRSKTKILDRGKFLVVESHTVELPDGRVIEDWPWVITPDYINVAAITEGGEFICFRQPKYAVEGLSLAVVGGYLEPGEDPLPAAKRELMEETGYQAPDAGWRELGHYAVDGNRGAGTGHMYLAQGCQRVAEPDADDLEEQTLLLLSEAEVRQALAAGEFRVLGWAAVVALALAALEEDR